MVSYSQWDLFGAILSGSLGDGIVAVAGQLVITVAFEVGIAVDVVGQVRQHLAELQHGLTALQEV